MDFTKRNSIWSFNYCGLLALVKSIIIIILDKKDVIYFKKTKKD